MEALTEPQQRVLDAIKDYMSGDQMSPTHLELADKCIDDYFGR